MGVRKIGETIHYASCETTAVHVPCPDCLGSKRLRVIMGDDSVVSIECVGCQTGYNRPSGVLTYWERKAAPKTGTIVGIEVRADGIEYRIQVLEGYTYLIKDVDAFDTEAAALERASALAMLLTQEAIANLARREKPSRSWAWNAHYHRKEINAAKKRIEYHTSKLSVAAAKSREEKAAAGFEKDAAGEVK